MNQVSKKEINFGAKIARDYILTKVKCNVKAKHMCTEINLAYFCV